MTRQARRLLNLALRIREKCIKVLLLAKRTLVNRAIGWKFLCRFISVFKFASGRRRKKRIKEDYLPKEDRFHAIPAYCKQIRQKWQWSFRVGFTKFQDWIYKNPGLDFKLGRLKKTRIHQFWR